MKKSISQWTFQPTRPLLEVFALARECGFDAQEAGVELSSMASGLGWHYPVTCPNAQVARRGIELTAQSLQIAQQLGLDTFLMVPGGVGADFIEGFQGAPYNVAYENAL